VSALAGEILTLGGGFLLAVLWFDLMFDVQALRAPREGPLPEPALASIAGYYRRVTTEAHLIELRSPSARLRGRSAALPMGRAVGIAMVGTIAASLVDLFVGTAPLVWRLASVPLLAGPVLLAARRVFPNAVRLGARSDPVEEQSRLARSIARDHVVCLAAILAFVAIQLAT
jgi:hypothetical protein